MAKPKVAILGATGYIGRSLLHECVSREKMEAIPFTRDAARAAATLRSAGIETPHAPRNLAELGDVCYDVVVNAAGIGSPKALQQDPRLIFEATESADALLLRYLRKYPDTRVFNLSSGAVFGLKAGEGITDASQAVFVPDALKEKDGYALAKLASEGKHRAYAEYAIVDLRVYSFFSRFVDLNDRFLLSEMAAAVQHGTILRTSANDLVRDYASGAGLYELVSFLLSRPPANLVCDVQTAASVTKFQLLEHFRRSFGLRYEVSSDSRVENPTGPKDTYLSRTTTLTRMGYAPKETSLEGIDREMRAYLANSSASS